MVKKYRVELTVEEQEELKALVSRGRAAAYKQTHARILLLSDENQAEGPMMDQEIARALHGGHRHGGTGTPPLRGGRSVGRPGSQRATEPAPEEVGWSG